MVKEHLLDSWTFDTPDDRARAEELYDVIRDRIGHSLFDTKVHPDSPIAADMGNPNVRLIEGELTSYEGEYSATGVRTISGHVYLAEVIQDLVGWKGTIKTFQWHVSNKPFTFYELEEAVANSALGEVQAQFYHRYSDLTGYLWTEEKVVVGGHDVLKEIVEARREIDGPAYLSLRVEK
jgi:hypothetical protein